METLLSKETLRSCTCLDQVLFGCLEFICLLLSQNIDNQCVPGSHESGREHSNSNIQEQDRS
ncbi:hypothetical protein HanXRQr2_Chr09g0387461 [Helianthus annuus]|uniref:Uncharacterized protein n=1 Tax=Helianthus annuus TaxID=4232 RepID=A0A9K3N8Z3_HELAN|nr:hypothetical protein HanXRQr2_Chr09g0387461 [Helianthus annuus]